MLKLQCSFLSSRLGIVHCQRYHIVILFRRYIDCIDCILLSLSTSARLQVITNYYQKLLSVWLWLLYSFGLLYLSVILGIAIVSIRLLCSYRFDKRSPLCRLISLSDFMRVVTQTGDTTSMFCTVMFVSCSLCICRHVYASRLTSVGLVLVGHGFVVVLVWSLCGQSSNLLW